MYSDSFLGWGETEPLGTSATNWPIVSAPGDSWWWMWSSRWNENWKGKPKYSEKTCLSTTLSTTNPTWRDLGSNPALRGGKPATNRLSYGTDLKMYLLTDVPGKARWHVVMETCMSAVLPDSMPVVTRWRSEQGQVGTSDAGEDGIRNR
jgi:hypothetical protein